MSTVYSFFRKDFNPYISIRAFRIGVIVALINYFVFGFLDFFLVDNSQLLLKVSLLRYALAVPAFIFAWWCSYQPFFKNKNQEISFVVALLAQLTLVLMIALLRENHTQYSLVYFAGLLLSISFGPIIMWQNMFYASISALLIVTSYGYILFLHSTPSVDIFPFFSETGILLSGCIFGIYCRYFAIRVLNKYLLKNVIIEKEKEHLEIATSKLEHANSINNKLLATLSHDIRGPLASLNGLMLLYSKGVLSANEMQEQSNKIASLLKGADNLLNNIVSWTILQQDQILETKTKSNLHELVEQKFISFKPLAKSKEISLINKVPKDLTVTINPYIINPVLKNLITNSLKYTEAGEIVVSAEKENSSFCISVSDTGIGITPQEVSKILAADNKYHREGTRGEKGAGLGLLICKELLRAANSDLQIKIDQQKGCTVSFRLHELA